MKFDLESLFGLQGRVALVTGAGGHLGETMTSALAFAGATTYLLGRSEAPLIALSERLNAESLRTHVLVGDVRSRDSIEHAVRRIQEDCGRLDVLVSNAHVGRGGTLQTSTEADFREAWELAVVSAANLLQSSRPLLVSAAQAGSPSVINVASMYGLVSPVPAIYPSAEAVNPPYYGAAKAGLIQLTRYAAVELAPFGVRVNSITPGPFPAFAAPDFLESLAARVPLGRVGRPIEIATALLYLASPASTFVTGSNVVVDGGWTAW